MHVRLLLMVLVFGWLGTPAAGQSVLPPQQGVASALPRGPESFEVLGISVEGASGEGIQAYVVQNSGLEVGQQITLPGDQSIAEAIRRLYKTNIFSDVKIVEERRVGDGVFLAIRVKEEPRLADYTFEGMKGSHQKDIKNKIPLLKGTHVNQSALERSKQIIRDYYEEKGYLLAEVDVERTVNEANALTLKFNVDRGPRVEVSEILVEGNEAMSDRKIRRKMKKTDENRWWRFWNKETFKRDEYEEDLQRVVQHYNEEGYYDARILRDSVYLNRDGDEPSVVVDLKLHEGPRYHVRNIEWEGNTVYADQTLTEALGFERGDVFNNTQLQENLQGNRRSSDVSSLYMNRGYMRFRAEPRVRVAEGDSLDLHFEIFEGDVYEFGDISIEGNQKTKEHVIRRELYTIPGQTFSRDAIQESIRRLSNLGYFDQQALASGPNVQIDEEEKTVDLGYTVEEVGSDQLELSGTFGRFGLVLMLRFGFNNFSIQDADEWSAWRPLPTGDGQKLSLSIQTNGRYYQNYSLSFTEPWFRGRPTPVGFSVAHSRINRNLFSTANTDDSEGSRFVRTSASVFHERRLKWPDDKFSFSTGLRYQFFNNTIYTSLPRGISQEITFQQSLSRNSVDNPRFPSRGSQVSLSLDVAPPFNRSNFIQYHKWRFSSTWHVPLAPKLSLSLSTDYGYVGSLTGERVEFERFLLGGSPFDAQGFINNFGREIVYMRGYPRGVLGPRLGNEPEGGLILNKYTSELRWHGIQTPQLQAAPYLFMDAANTWDKFAAYNPARLFRSAGVGVRLFLPILGMVELTYGYNFDEFDSLRGVDHTGEKRWLFQFSLGQGFGQ